MDESLNNIAHLGPARRAALEAAGITTRSQLAQASVDQLVGVTGMPRSAAQKVLASLQGSSSPDAAPVPQEAPLPEELPPPGETVAAEAPPAEPPPAEPPAAEARAVEEAVVMLAPALPPAPQPEDGTETVDARAQLEKAVLRVDTALADATGGTPARKLAPELNRQLAKLAALVDELPRHAERLKPKRMRGVTARLQAVADRLRRFAAMGSAGPKEQEKLRQEIREQRKKIAEALAVAKPKNKASGGKKK